MLVSASDCGFLENVIKNRLAVSQKRKQVLLLMSNNSLSTHFPHNLTGKFKYLHTGEMDPIDWTTERKTGLYWVHLL